MVQKGRSRLPSRRRAILLAAAQHFRDKGFYSTGMRDIAQTLGMTVGNLYYYFKNKEELLAFCQEEATELLIELAAWVGERDHLDPPEQLGVLIVGHVWILNEGIPGSLAHMQVEDLGEEWRERIQRQRDAYERAIRSLVERGSDSGAFREVDVKVAANAVLGAVNWTVKWFRHEGPQTAREIGEAMAVPLVRGFLASDREFRVPEEENTRCIEFIRTQLMTGLESTSLDSNSPETLEGETTDD